MSNPPNKRFSDGFMITIGDTVDYDSEAEFYKTPSKVGQKVPTDKEKLDKFAKAAGHALDERNADNYPVKVELHLTNTDFVKPLVNFLQEAARRANSGHSFSLVADEDNPFKCSIDGDGADKIGYIFLNGKDITGKDL